jgi:hypothetical protein
MGVEHDLVRHCGAPLIEGLDQRLRPEPYYNILSVVQKVPLVLTSGGAGTGCACAARHRPCLELPTQLQSGEASDCFRRKRSPQYVGQVIGLSGVGRNQLAALIDWPDEGFCRMGSDRTS